jgi:hypothetical protein
MEHFHRKNQFVNGFEAELREIRNVRSLLIAAKLFFLSTSAQFPKAIIRKTSLQGCFLWSRHVNKSVFAGGKWKNYQ